MVQTHCASLEENKVEESLYYLFGQDYKGRSDVRWGANATPAKLQSWPRRQQAYNAEEIYELDDMDTFEDNYANEYEDAEEVYYEDATEGDYEASWDGQAAEETEDGYYQNDENSGDFDGALEEAYAAYLDARRQFANLRAARGYYPVVALAPDASPSSSGQQQPVSPGHGKGKMKSRGQGKSKGSSSRAEEKVPIHLERAHLPQGLQPTLGDLPTVSSVAKLDILQLNAQADHQSRKEHLPALPQRG